MYAAKAQLRPIESYPVFEVSLETYRREPASAVQRHRDGYRVVIRDGDDTVKYIIEPFSLDEIIID